jgi:hypothetical protein
MLFLGAAADRWRMTLSLIPQEQDQLASLRAQNEDKPTKAEAPSSVPREDRDYEAGFGGQEDLEDRYATTSGEH